MTLDYTFRPWFSTHRRVFLSLPVEPRTTCLSNACCKVHCNIQSGPVTERYALLCSGAAFPETQQQLIITGLLLYSPQCLILNVPNDFEPKGLDSPPSPRGSSSPPCSFLPLQMPALRGDHSGSASRATSNVGEILFCPLLGFSLHIVGHRCIGVWL